jgi:hypothetical protein
MQCSLSPSIPCALSPRIFALLRSLSFARPPLAAGTVSGLVAGPSPPIRKQSESDSEAIRVGQGSDPSRKGSKEEAIRVRGVRIAQLAGPGRGLGPRITQSLYYRRNAQARMTSHVTRHVSVREATRPGPACVLSRVKLCTNSRVGTPSPVTSLTTLLSVVGA